MRTYIYLPGDEDEWNVELDMDALLREGDTVKWEHGDTFIVEGASFIVGANNLSGKAYGGRSYCQHVWLKRKS